MVLRLESKLEAATTEYREVNPGHIRLQDRVSRVTILTWAPQQSIATVCANPDSIGENGNDGYNALTLRVDSVPLRMRIISEDVDTFHHGADQEENYFGDIMIQDFFNPVEVYC